MIFDANFSNRKKIGFSWNFCIYNRKKVNWIVILILGQKCVKVLILAGFNDIGCDIGILE